MCYLASAKLHIAVSNFSKNLLNVPMYYLVDFSSFSLHYSFILCYRLSSFLDNLVVGSNGIEPSTSRLSGVRSNHLSYEPIF